MSTVTLRIQVDKSGATENIGEVKRGLSEMGAAGQQGGQQAAQGVGALRSALDTAKSAVAGFVAAYAAIQGLRGVVNLSDEYQGLSDRLKLATADSGSFAAAQAGVFAVAQQTGTALGAVTDLYVALSNSTKQLGLDQSQLMTITQAINQSFVVSGTSAASAEVATRQLGQAFASGVLRGDEFNSMMENAPGLASALATSLGVTTGQLRAMAAEGKLTSDVLAQGLLTQAPAIAAQFDAMGLTVGRAFTQLSNAVLKFVGEASQASGAGQGLANVISGIASNLPAFAFGLMAVAAGYTAIYAAAIVANPAIGFTATLIAGISAALGVAVVAYSAFKLGEYMADEFVQVREAGAYLIISMNAVWSGIQVGAFAAFTAIRVAFTTVVDAIQEKVADIITLFTELGQFEIFGQSVDFTYGQAEALDTLVLSLRGATDGAADTDAAMAELRGKMDASAKAADDLANGLFDGITAYEQTKGAAGEATTATQAVGTAAALTKGQIKELEKAQRDAVSASNALTAESERLSGVLGGPIISAYTELAAKLRQVDEWEIQLRADQGLSREEADRLRAVRMQLAQSLVTNVTALQNAETAEQAYLRELREAVRVNGLSGAARAQAIIQINAEAAARRLLKGGTEEQIAVLRDQIIELQNQGAAAEEAGRKAQAWQQYWDGAIDSVAGAFGDFVAGGLKDFGDFADSLKRIARQIMSDLVAQFARRIVLNLGVNAQGGAGGSILSGASGGGGFGGLMGSLLGGAGGLLGGGFGTGLLASGSIFSGAGLLGGITGSVSAGFASIAGGSIMQGLGLLAGPIGLLAGSISLLTSIFGSKKPPDVRFGGADASIRNREGSFSTVFGQVQAGSRQISYQEMIQPIQQFDQAIQGIVLATGGGAAQLTAIGQALSRWSVDLTGSAATAENVLGSRFNAVLTAFSTDVQGFVGTTGTLEERLSRFTDALTIAALAAGDNGITQNFGELATLLTRFRDGTENLGDTFARLSVGLSMIDQAMGLLGTEFRGTRLEAATFAGELIQAAGGMEAFSNILSGALNALFTETERNQFIADQAQSSLNAMLTGLNISGTGMESIRQQLRQQLRDALASGDTELVTRLLQAGNALNTFANAIGLLGDEAVTATNSINFGGSSISRGGSLTSPAGTAAAPVTPVTVGQTTNTILNQQTTILQQIATNTSRTGNGEKAGGDAAASILSRIEGLIQQAVRTQVQEALKRTTGANKRSAVPA